jgi:acyl-CoA thioester hydrolase
MLERLEAAAGPTRARPPYRFSAFMRVGFDETDAQGVVYYGRYFPYFDRSRVEYLRHLQLLNRDLGGREFVMRRSICEYEAPARFDDPLEVFIRTAAIGRTSLRYEFEVHHAEQGMLLARAEQVLVMIARETRRPTAVPDELREAVGAFEEALA